MNEGDDVRAVVGGEGLGAGGNVCFPEGVIDGTPVLNALWVEVGGAWDNENPGGFLNKNNIGSG